MIIGIDLGTTNSLVAVWKDGQATLIPNSLGNVLTPSVVSVDGNGHILVGQAARERLVTHPELTAAAFKRFMGSQKTYTLGRKVFRPEELSSLVLGSLKADAEAWLGEPVSEAVITVPAYFNDIQRNATRIAAELAGLKVRRLLNEPTAAAMAYGLHQAQGESKFLVLDLGGGTFDVTLLDLFEGIMEVRASAGDNCLGGEDFTAAIAEAFVQHATANFGEPAVFWEKNASQVLSAAEQVKRNLSGVAGPVSVTMTVHANDRKYEWPLTEEHFLSLSKKLLERIRTPIEKALRDSRVRLSELDEVVLVGGSTRMPILRKLVVQMFGRFPATQLHPDEAIALGAAVQAGLTARDAALDEVVMTDVAPYSLGVDTSIRTGENEYAHGQFSPIIERNTVIPASKVQTYHPMHDSQKVVEFGIYQGEARLVKDNIFLGKISLSVPPGKATEIGIDVRFSYDANGVLEVDVINATTGERKVLVIQNDKSTLTPEQVEASLKKLEALKIHPREQMENRTLIARADRLFSQSLGQARESVRHHLAVFEAVLDRQEPNEIRHAASSFKAYLDSIDVEIFH